MPESRTKNAVRNIAAGIINKIVMLLMPFVIRAVLIRTLGSEYLGLNSLFSSILQVLNLAELGFGSAVVYSLYKPIAEKDTKTICALMNLYRRIYTIIGFVVLGIGILLMPFLKYLINGSYPSDINLQLLFLLYLINTCFTYWLFAYKSVLLVAHQRSDETSNVLTFTSAIQYVLQIVILYNTKNYYLYILVNLATTALNNVIVSKIVDKQYPQYVCKGEVSKSLKKSIKTKVAGLLINKICQTTRNSLDSIFISAFLGLTIVAIYNNYYTIMAAVVGVLQIVCTSILAGVGNSIVSESKSKNYYDMCKFNFIYMWLSGWSTICMLCMFQRFMTLWMGTDMVLNMRIVYLICIYFYILKMGDIRGTYSDAKGLWWENRYRAIAESIVNIVLNYVLGKLMGLAGIVLATIISLFVLNFLYGSQILFKYYFTNVSVMDYFKRQGLYASITLLAAFITYGITNRININGVWGLLIVFVICLVVPNCIYLLVYYRNKDFKESIKFIKQIIKK